MSPVDPQTAQDQSLLAPLLAVKPIFYVVGLIATAVLFGAGFVTRVEKIESDVYVLKVLACRQYPNDTLCEGAKR